jgi:uncharacterized protein YigE (DUF2233 family)
MWSNLWIAALALANSGVRADTVECSGKPPAQAYTVCAVDASRLEVFWLDEKNAPFLNVHTLQTWLAKRGRQLVFATNAGEFKSATEPEGLLIASGITRHEINLKDGTGNFYEKPNGVFWVNEGTPHIDGSERFNGLKLKPSIATQAGPLLIVDGKPRLDLGTFKGKTHSRSAVCIDSSGAAKFVFSSESVTIASLGEYMDKQLRCSAALYLDGCRTFLFSRSPQLDLQGACLPRMTVGPMLGIAEPAIGKR